MVALISFFCVINNINADNVSISGSVHTSGANGSTCGNPYNGCYDSNSYEFRVTLVDKNGQIIQGTHSVDYRWNNSATTYSKSLDDKIKQFVNYNSGNDYVYKYKYGENNGNMLTNNTYSYYDVKLADVMFGTSYAQNMVSMVNSFTNIVKDREGRFGIAGGTTGNFDFLTMFLYHCGYLDSDKGFESIDNPMWINEKKIFTNSENPIYLLIEPTYTIYAQIFRNKTGQYYLYGTSKELTEYLIRESINNGYQEGVNGYLVGSYLTAAFTYNMGANMRTYLNDPQIASFNAITKQIDNQKLTTINNGGQHDSVTMSMWRDISDPEYGYGATVLNISALFPEEENINTDVYIQSSYCTETASGINDGKISFKINSGSGFNSKEKFLLAAKNYSFKESPSNGKIYCYDDVEYDFSQTINRITNTQATVSDSIQIEPGYVTINRHCVIEANKQEYETSKHFMNDFEDYYKDKKIPLTLYNQTIDLEPINITDQSVTTKVNPFMRDIYETYDVTQTISFGYKNNNSYIQIYNDVNNYGDKEAYIDLSDASFGYSTELRNKIKNNELQNSYSSTEIVESKTITYNFITRLTNPTENHTCKFTTHVNPPEETGGFKTPKIQFRTIDLDNPFPARDGSSRLPGSNWLGKDNNVRTYINHNRGVQGNEVYEKDPIYTITLTPSNMINIREYNKKNNYSYIELDCKGENNTECFSKFLRDTSYIETSNKKGICMDVNSDNNTSKLTYDQSNADKLLDIITNTDPLTHSFTDELEFDFNGDGIVTIRDQYIHNNANKTTSFYTCADKTYENSGYIRKGQ